MSLPYRVDDGNFNLALQDGPTEYQMPFSNEGDFTTEIASRRIRIDAEAYRKPIKGTRLTISNHGLFYLVDHTDAREIGCAVLEWTETYANLPIKRIIPQTIVYTHQWIISVNFELEILEITKTRNALVTYEYFLTEPDVIIAPKWIAAVNGQIFSIGGAKEKLNNNYNGPILAQDSESRLWMAGIYERKTIRVKNIPFSQVLA